MSNKRIPVRNTVTNEIEYFTPTELLLEINRDRSEAYTLDDLEEGLSMSDYELLEGGEL